MTHEPECESLQDTVVLPADCWICHLTKAAYQRGREDAAEATVPVSRKFNGIMTTYADAVYSAARGNGEQK